MNAIETAIYSALTNYSALTTALGGSYVYDTIAPQSQEPPYVIFMHDSGGYENLTPSSGLLHRYYVKAVSTDHAQAETLRGHIAAALHKAALTVSGYTNVETLAEDERNYIEQRTDGSIVHHRGQVIRVRIDD